MAAKSENADDDTEALEALESEQKEFNKVSLPRHSIPEMKMDQL